MTSFEAFLYGAVQGLTEYLPVSSSAHLVLLPKFLGTQDPGLAFDVFLHAGTLLATLIYFWRDWIGVLASLRGKRVKAEIGWKPIAIATIPALAAGALLHKAAETVFRGNSIQATALVLGGLLLWASDHFAAKKRHLKEVTSKDAVLVGLMQCLALVPGMSRSGSTISAARLLGFERSAAARFSFLISGPVTAAALLFELRKFGEFANGQVGGLQLAIAGVSSFVFGIFAIGGLLRLVKRFGYLTFALYRVALAIVIVQVLGV
jgi:undecaprenyl-diphosphatase